MKKLKEKDAFTLVELIIVIAILAVLASIAVPSLLGNVEKARMAKDESYAKVIGDLIMMGMADGELDDSITYTNYLLADGDTGLRGFLKQKLGKIPKAESKKYGSTRSGTFHATVNKDEVVIFVYRGLTKHMLYPENQD